MTFTRKALAASLIALSLGAVAPASAQQLVVPAAVRGAIVASVNAGDSNALSALVDADPALAVAMAQAILEEAAKLQAIDPLLAAKAAIVALNIYRQIPGSDQLPGYGMAFRLANVNKAAVDLVFERGVILQRLYALDFGGLSGSGVGVNYVGAEIPRLAFASIH